MPQFMPNYHPHPILWQFLLPLCLFATLFCAPFAIPCALANNGNLPATVKQALKQAQIPEHAMATWVQEIGSKRAWMAANAQQAMQPASIIKLLTTYAALDILGPAERWKTQAYISTPIEQGVLHGDLILQGGGDPKLVYESFWQFLRQLRQQGLREIQGNVIIDRSLFQLPPHDAAAFDGDPAKPYNAGPDALLLNFKSLRLRFEPNLSTQQVQVQTEPNLAGLNIIAPSLALDANNTPCADWQEQLTLEWRAQALYIHGNYAPACGVQNWSIHPYGLSQNDYALGLFQALWQELGGSFKGQIQDGKRPPNAIFLAQWESPSLTEIIRDINKFSNNVMARQLLITLGVRGNSANNSANNGGTPEHGIQTIQQWLTDKQLSSPELVLENGAGLSRQEQISAQSMSRILLHAYASPWMPEFVSSLPVVGYDGTMRRRLQQTPMAGQAHIKTGSLHEVRTMAGYVRAASGKIYVLTSMINHTHASKGQAAHDLLLQWIHKNG
jgi:serine-type D-Ala-D-Ala carboxypeptidase/endopeptidase (penicillin-binding protein 4)